MNKKQAFCLGKKKAPLTGNLVQVLTSTDCMVLVSFIICVTEIVFPTALVRSKWQNVHVNAVYMQNMSFQTYSFNHKQAIINEL